MTGRLLIPFLDLIAQHAELEPDLTEVFQRAVRTARFVGGPMVEAFETAFATFCGTSHSVGVGNGTEALLFALLAGGVRPGDAVVTVPHTFIATAEAIVQAGGLPEFVDIDERTYNLDVEKLREYLEQRCTSDTSGRLISRRSGRPVSAIVPVHLYGQVADMDAIHELAEQHRLLVVEDACQAHGAEYWSRRQRGWQRAGSLARAAAFSFYPGKNLGACGEAGAVTTSDPDVAAKVRMLRDHGQARKYHHEIEGYNGRLDAIQAGILHAKLPRLAQWNLARRDRAAQYSRLLSGAPRIALPHEPEWSRAVYHLYVIRVPHRDALVDRLTTEGTGTGIHYPIPLHLQNAYAALGYRTGDFPVAERAAAEVVSLPMYPQLTTAQQERVAEQIHRMAWSGDSDDTA